MSCFSSRALAGSRFVRIFGACQFRADRNLHVCIDDVADLRRSNLGDCLFAMLFARTGFGDLRLALFTVLVTETDMADRAGIVTIDVRGCLRVHDASSVSSEALAMTGSTRRWTS